MTVARTYWENDSTSGGKEGEETRVENFDSLSVPFK